MTIVLLPMGESLVKSILVKIALALLVLALVDLVFINYWVLQNSKKETSQSGSRTVFATPSPLASLEPSPAGALPVPSPTPSEKKASETIVQNTTKVEQTVVQTAQKEIFIPIGDGSTNSNSYVNLSGVQVTVDSNKYLGIERVDFEANIWVTNGNGKMYAQLYNSTDGHPVWNSEISTSSANGVLTVSAPITLDSGQRTYIVQAKTNLSEFAANVKSARIKITLK